PSGQITFHSENGRSALGQIDAEGNYTLTTFEPGDGAIVGNHIVTIQATKVGPGGMGFASPEDEMRWTEQGMKKGKVGGKILITGKVEWLVPEVYASPQTTKLKATVEDKYNTINFEIEK